MPSDFGFDPHGMVDRPRDTAKEEELRGKVEEALERARRIADGAPLAGGGQRKLLDYIITELDTRIKQVEGRLASSQTLRDFSDFLGNLSDFIGEA